jgi:hypothetical protein
MACFHPLKAFKDSSGVRFLSSDSALFNLLIPCGQCIGCRLERSRQWAMRCMHEASLYEDNCFITLTYDDAHLPEDLGLHYKDFQLFLKRLRKDFAPRKIRYYMCGEYGEQYGRPHFHALLFNFNFADRLLHSRTSSGSDIYTSELLQRYWTAGFSSVGDATFESAAYVARYVMKKVTGHGSTAHYEVFNSDTGEIFQRRPEFNKMSLKPGIGAGWFNQFKPDVYPHDYVVVNGNKTKPPKYYDKLLKRVDNVSYEDIKSKRMLDMWENLPDNSPQRLNAKELVAEARLSQLKRSI